MKRLQLLCGLALALLLGFFSGSASADYRIAVASDPHYIAPVLTDGGLYYQSVLASGDSKFMPYSKEILDAFVEELLTAEEVPDALLLTGDLTFNGAVMSLDSLLNDIKANPKRYVTIKVF